MREKTSGTQWIQMIEILTLVFGCHVLRFMHIHFIMTLNSALFMKKLEPFFFGSLGAFMVTLLSLIDSE